MNKLAGAVALTLALGMILGCESPVATNSAVPTGAKNAVTISINTPLAKSGLIDITTASSRSDTYDIILYNAANTYRTIVSSAATAATLTNVVPATYAVLVVAGKKNGATTINGYNAGIILGTGDIPYLPSGPTLTGVAAELDGRGVTVAATGTTAISVTLQNIVYSISSSAAGTNPYTVGISNAFSVTMSYSLFSNLTAASNAVSGGVSSPFGYTSLSGSVNQFKVTGAQPTFNSTSVTGNGVVASFHPITLTGSFTAPATSGTSTIALDSGGLANGTNQSVGMVQFRTAAGSYTTFAGLAAQNGTPLNWFLPSAGLSVAMPAVTNSSGDPVPGAATVNFSAPGADVSVGWGSGL